jgi:tetratricopeptide (TPR) repeat protein
MTRRSQLHRSRLAQLLLGVAPALLLAAVAATPADARPLQWSYSICREADQRRIERAIAACDAVIEHRGATLRHVQNALISRANMRITRNDLTGAQADLEQAQRMGADDPATMVALGQVRARLNDPDAALAAFNAAAEDATSADPAASYEASIAIGQIELERRQWSEALASYTRAYRATSDATKRARALIGRGHARLGSGEIEAAIADYQQAVSLDDNSLDALLALGDAQRVLANRGDVQSFGQAALTYASALGKIGPESTGAEQRRQLARAYAGRGDLYVQRYLRTRNQAGSSPDPRDLRQASLDFENAVAADIQNVDALAGRARVYAEAPATYQRAVADLDRAVRIRPDDGELYRQRGDVFTLIGDDERAMRDYDDALAHGGNQSYRTYFRRGEIYLNAGDYVRADQSFQQAVALAQHGPLPPDLDTPTAMAEALWMRSRATWNLIDAPGLAARDVAVRARNLADDAARWRPNQSRYEAGRCLTRSVAGGEWSTAEQACRDAIRLAGNPSQLSEAYGTMGMLQLRWALAGAPNDASEATHLQYAVNYFGDAVRAESAPADVTRSALYLYAQGVALECLGRQIEANRVMRQALDADRSVESRFLTHRIRHCQA